MTEIPDHSEIEAAREAIVALIGEEYRLHTSGKI